MKYRALEPVLQHAAIAMIVYRLACGGRRVDYLMGYMNALRDIAEAREISATGAGYAEVIHEIMKAARRERESR